jgi:hypothetical protein
VLTDLLFLAVLVAIVFISRWLAWLSFKSTSHLVGGCWSTSQSVFAARTEPGT